MDYLDIGEGILAGIGSLAIAKTIFKTAKNKKRGENIGKIFLRGKIQEYNPTSTILKSKEQVNPMGIEKLVKEALEDNVKGIIFDIDSPGGAVVPSKEIADYIKKIEVPTMALIKNCAASGAYWIASACDKIIANEYSMIGSIGVIFPHIEISKFAEKQGINYDGIQSGEYKDMGNMFRPFSDKEREILQEELDAVHEGFIQTIANNRNLDLNKVREVAKGLTYHGNKALELGLIDSVGNADKAIALIEEAGKFKHKDVIEYKTKKKGLAALSNMGANAYDMGAQIANGFMQTIQSDDRSIR